MSEVNVQIQNPNTSVNITDPEIIIQIAENSIEIVFEEGQPISIQVQNPVIEVNMGCCTGGGGGAADGNGIYTGSGTIPDGTAASLEAAGQFTINYANTGLPALWAIDNNNIQLRSPDGNVRMQVDNDQAEIESATGFRLTIDGSSGTAGQVPTAQGDGTTLWEDQAGGGASITDITYADMQTAITGGTLTEGAFYRITDAAGTDLGFVCQAIKTNEITVNGTGGYLNADFQAVGDYSGATIPAVPYYVYYTGASGAFTVGETITGDDNGSTAIIVSDDEGGTLEVSDVTGDWNTETTFLGDTSGNTATFDGYDEGAAEIVPNQLGIWRTGFEAISIPYTNISPDYIEYSTASGPLDDGETYTTDMGGSGTIIHDDGASIVTLIPSGALVAGEIITGDNSGNTVTVDTYTNPAFAVGDTITGGTTGATAVIVTDDGASGMTAYMTSAGVAFDGSEVLDNGNGVTADQDGAAGTPAIVQRDVVIWNLLHWQLTDATLLDGTNPATNTAAYTQLLKTDAGQGYVEAWDIGSYNFGSNGVIDRIDTRGNKIKSEGITVFQFGSDFVTSNICNDGFINIRNYIGGFYSNTFLPGATLYNFSNIGGAFSNNIINNGGVVSNINAINSTIENNILENGAQLTGITTGANCSISNNSIGSGSSISNVAFLNDSTIQNSVLTGGGFINNITANDNDIGLSGNVLTGGRIADIILNVSGARIENNIITRGRMAELTFGGNVSLSQNTLAPDAVIESLTLGADTVLENNIIENSGSLTGIESGANCSISRNKIGQGATLGGSTTMGDGAQFNDLDIRANKQISNKTLDAGVTFSDKIVQLTTDETETYSANVDGNRTQPGFSDIPGTIDITGITTLDCTAAFAQYRGVYNLTSGNSTEAIDTITNPPTLFPFTIRPASGLVLTITGTAYSGIAAGQIALKAASYDLDGDKGEYIVLEIDPLGTGCLIEKQVVNGLI